MYKKYYEPYEQMYTKFEVGERRSGGISGAATGEVADGQSDSAQIITPVPEPVDPLPPDTDAQAPGASPADDVLASDDGQEDTQRVAESAISEQDSASYIVSSPLDTAHKLNIKNLFQSLELDDLIIIGLIIILLLEDGDDIPLVLILGVLLLSDLF